MRSPSRLQIARGPGEASSVRRARRIGLDPPFLTSTDDLAALAGEWEALAERVHASPFMRPGWVAAWWRAFGSGELQLKIARWASDRRLAALLPLQIAEGQPRSPTNWHTPEFGIVSESRDAASAVLAEALRDRPRRVSIAFACRDQALAFAEASSAQRYLVLRRQMQRSPYVLVDGDWDAYERSLPRKTRSELKRRGRLLARRGAVALDVTGGAGLEALLEEGFAVEASGWKGRKGTAIRSQPDTLQFYGDVARWAAARGWLRLAFLRLDGRAIAFDLCLEHEGRHYLLKTGYDPAFRAYGPGKLLRHAMIARAFRERLRCYEFLGSTAPWKLEWAQKAHERELVQSFSSSLAGVVDWAVLGWGRPLLDALGHRVSRCLRAPPRHGLARALAPAAAFDAC